MEQGDSVFEDAVRKLPIRACAAFSKNGVLAPVSFVTTNTQLNQPDAAKVAQQYPKVTAVSWRFILEAEGRNSEPASGKRVAALFSGGPASGGHNVLAGLKDILGERNVLLGVREGPKGLLAGNIVPLHKDVIDRVRNTGGFDLLGSDRTKLKTPEQLRQVKRVCQEQNIDAIIIIGGDDSNTNAALLAEYLFTDVHPDGRGVQVIGVPKTMDGDLQINGWLPISFGFHTATRIYAEMVGNILQDTPSSRKYWHFIKVMGRTASHVALEIALQTRPPVTLISEEVKAQAKSLGSIVNDIADAVIARAADGKQYGVVLIPEGLLEFIPEVDALLLEIEQLLASDKGYLGLDRHHRRKFFIERVRHSLFAQLPHYIQDMLIAERDSHGNLAVSQIPTERLIADLVTAKVAERAPQIAFNPQTNFFGYEGRCGAPTAFDAMFTYNLGLCAGSLVLDHWTGMMASITDFDAGGRPVALPLAGIIDIERREEKDAFVIKKALVTLDSPAFLYFAQNRDAWRKNDVFRSPGPRQLWGPTRNEMPLTVALNQNYASALFPDDRE